MSLYVIAAVILFQCSLASAEDLVKFGGFLDSYYAFDFNQPHDDERLFTTQPVRHNEPNINLVYLDGAIKSENLRSRVALQAGDSVRRNTEYEPGGEELEYIQEAFAGFKTHNEIWIDAGVFLGHIGAESWISKENFTYTRSLNLDYVPYYSAGIRISTDKFQLHIMNGWQNISENNSAKAVGTQYVKDVSPKLKLTWNTFFGDEEVVSNMPRFRSYNNFILAAKVDENWDILGAFDLGHQAQQNNSGNDVWFAGTFTTRFHLDDKKSVSWRAEYYNDRHQANIITNTSNGFEVLSSSFNFDYKMSDNILWRNEIRGFYSIDKIFPQNDKRLRRLDSFYVSSFAIWF